MSGPREPYRVFAEWPITGGRYVVDADGKVFYYGGGARWVRQSGTLEEVKERIRRGDLRGTLLEEPRKRNARGRYTKNPRSGRFDRCVRKVTRSRSARNPYAVCAPTLKPRRRRNPVNRAHTAYYDAIKADDAYQAELRRVYGRRAQEMRYHTKEHTDKALIAAGQRKRAADEAFRAEYRLPRLKNPRRRRSAVRRTNVTRRGPRGELFSLIARKGAAAPMVYTGDKFARHGKPVLFPTLATAKATARFMQRHYPTLRGYSIWAREV